MKPISAALYLLFFFQSCSDAEVKNDSSANVKTAPKDSVIGVTQAGTVDTMKKSISAIAANKIDGADVSVKYHSPAVRNRVIWGGLVPYGQVWVTGAHQATALECNSDFVFGDKLIPAGKYALFTIPGKDEWTVILNRNWKQHLTDEYNEADDVARLTVKPREAAHQERLRYTVEPTGEKKFSINMQWERVMLSVQGEVKN